MSSGNIVPDIFSSLLVAGPAIAAWTIAIVLSVIMLRRGGAKAEKFLLAGSCVMLARTLLIAPAAIVLDSLMPQLGRQGLSPGRVIQYYTFPHGLLTLAGVVLLVYAFWTKFKVTAHV